MKHNKTEQRTKSHIKKETKPKSTKHNHYTNQKINKEIKQREQRETQ